MAGCVKTVEFRKLFVATFGVAPVLGPQLRVPASLTSDPATQLGYQLLFGLTPSCPYALQAAAGWSLHPSTERFLEGLCTAPHEADVMPTSGPLAAVAQVRALAAKRDAMRRERCSVSRIDHILHVLSDTLVELTPDDSRQFTSRLLEDQTMLVTWLSPHLLLTDL